MKKNFILLLFLSIGIACFASNTRPGYQPATIVSVEEYDPAAYTSGFENPTDAPLRTEVYAYDVGIEVGCSLYKLRYQAVTDYLPQSLAPERPVGVLIQKPFMLVDVPNGGDLRMQIRGTRRVKDTACAANN